MPRPGVIFVGGCGRSGTTLLRDLLLGHKNVWGVKHESHFFAPPQPNLVTLHRAARVGKLTSATVASVAEHIRARLGTPYGNHVRARVGEDGLDRAVRHFFSRAEAWADGAPHPEAREAIASWALGLSWQSAKSKPRARRWCEKSPHNVHNFIELDELYPGARLIHIIRDPRDTIDSLSRQRWTRTRGYHGIAGACKWYAEWLDGYEAALARGLRDLPGYCEVRYEALVRFPHQWRMLFRHLALQLPPRPKLRSVHEGRSKRWKPQEQRAFARLARSRPRVDEWVAETRRLTGRR